MGERIPNVGEAVAFYLADLRLEGGTPRAIQTRRSYLKPLRNLALPLHEFTPTYCRQLLADSLDRLKPASVNAFAVGLTCFGHYCQQRGWLASDPMLGVPRPRRTQPRHRFLTPAELQRVWAAADSDDTRLCLLLLMQGLRAAEVVGLRWADADLASGTLFVRTVKGGAPRRIAMGALLLAALTDAPRTDDRLVPCTTQALWRRVRRLGVRAGIRLHPHLFRHSFASNWMLETRDMASLQVLGGWSSNVMPRYYARSVVEQAALQKDREVDLTSRLLQGAEFVQPHNDEAGSRS